MEIRTLKLYAITDRTWLKEGQTLEAVVEEAIAGGATMIQLREKHLTGDELKELALRVQAVCRSYRVPFIVNDDVMLAKEIGADGVHVGASDMDVAQAREVMGADKIVGATAKTVAQAVTAQAAGADYLGSGAIFGTTTKADAKPMTRELLIEIIASVDIPVVAIGGIDETNVGKLTDMPIAGVAVVSGIFAKPDIQKAALDLRIKLEGRQVIHSITNHVTVNDVANIILAVGASPIMSHHPQEVAQVQENADALLINMGAMEDFEAMKTAYKTALKAGHPIVIDPVGAGGNSFRRQAIKELLEIGSPTCIRGNYAEIRAILEDQTTMRGLDDYTECAEPDKKAVVQALAKRLNCIIAATGETDIVCDGESAEIYEITSGHPMQKLITGSGCMLSGVIASALALAIAPSSALVASVCDRYGRCAEAAAVISAGRGTMTFKNNFIDEVSRNYLTFS